MELANDATLTNRHYDADGRLHITRTPITKATVNPYYGSEIPDSSGLGLDPHRIYYLLRDAEELKKAVPTFANIQLMAKHVAVNADAPQQDYVVGTIGSNVEFEAPYVMADMSVWDSEAIAGIETDLIRELSASYKYRADMTPGEYDGKKYDGVMRDIVANHVALVKAGRAGSDVLAADSRLENTTMTETKFGKALYAVLCATSSRMANDSRLRPAVIGLTPSKCDVEKLRPVLLAMDADLRKDETEDAIRAVKRVAKDESEEEREKHEREGMEHAKDKRHAKDADVDDDDDDDDKRGEDKRRAKDARHTKDMSFDEWADENDDDSAKDRRAARDAEEDDEDREKRLEYENKAEDAKRMARDDFDGLVSKLEKKGYSKTYATKIAGKVATEKGDDARIGRRAKDAQTKEEKAMWAQMREDGTADDPADDARIKHAMDEFKKELRDAEDARQSVRPVVGDVLAFDSASDIYKFALDEMNVDHVGVHGVQALRALFNVARAAREPAKSAFAFDSNSMESKIHGVSRAIREM